MSESENKPCETPQAISFTTFVLSLSTAALQHLGVASVDEQKQACVNLPLARQTIEILEMLESKTAGNLSEGETKLLGNILYDLRMRYVETCRSCQE